MVSCENRIRRGPRGLGGGSCETVPPLLGCFSCNDRYKHPVIGLLLKLDRARCGCKQSVVFAHADIGAWMHFRAALADNDVAGKNRFAAEFLYAKAAAV